MKAFMDRDFLLHTPTAEALYHEYAEAMPIIDYHCHVDPAEIESDQHYATLTQLWLGGDHYKWRALRENGVPEQFVTGNAPDEEKFQKWAETIPNLIGNPLYHWTHLELARYFGVTEPLTGCNAAEIYAHCNRMLTQPDFGARGIIARSNVRLICTTDDPTDSLAVHERLATDPTAPAAVLPAFRPDKAMRANQPGFAAYVDKLESVVGYAIGTIDDMRQALLDRIACFAARGCTVSDHGLDSCFCVLTDDAQLTDILCRARAGGPITQAEQQAYHTALLLTVAREYARRGWVMQLHFGCLRNNSSRMFRSFGPDAGCDAINDAPNAAGLARLLDTLERDSALPRSIVYSLNPVDNGMIDSVINCFQTDSDIPCKLQHGTAWWFNDHKAGMESQLRSLMSIGCIAHFVGMLTDSRSFLSYTRHEYFRRILCNLLGDLVENGEYPRDMAALGAMVQNICYYNALRYFRFEDAIAQRS